MSDRWSATSRHLVWLARRARRRAWQALCRRLFLDRSREVTDSILVAGTARSGTTWVGSTITRSLRAREVFEPFNAAQVPQAQPFGAFPYRRADDPDEPLAAFCQSILTGRLRGPWIDRYVDRLRPRGRVVKAVRANLMLAWLHETFPTVPIVLVIRHPCAVALSREQSGWNPDEDIRAILSQPRLVEDHLSDVLDVIRSARSDAAKRAVIWCVHYRIPMRQLEPGAVIEAWYENLCRDPGNELHRLYDRIGIDWSAEVLRQAARPSAKTLRTSAVLTGEDTVERWRAAMPPKDIDEVLAVVRAFSMEHLYGDGPMPLSRSLFP